MDVEAPGDGSRNVQSTISLIGCGISRAYVPDPAEEEEEEDDEEEEEILSDIDSTKKRNLLGKTG
jgi:hypothetical protein